MSALLPVLRYLAPLAPVLVGIGLWLFVRRRRRVAERLGDPRLVRLLAGEELRRVPWLRVVLAFGAALALAAAVADPRGSQADAAEALQGGPVVLVFDVSTSMLVQDVEPSRLALARDAARDLARALSDAPVGVVVFAGRAYALTPPTSDPAALDLYLEALDPAMATQTGSSLAAAIRQGIGLLAAGREPVGAVVLISDGNTMDEPAAMEAALRLAVRAGIPVHALGVGTAAGGPVPDVDLRTGRRDGFIQDPTGGVAVSRLDEPLLRTVAAETGGEYLSVSQPQAVERLAGLLRDGGGTGGGGEGGQGAPHFAWFAAVALLLLTAESVAARPWRGRTR